MLATKKKILLLGFALVIAFLGLSALKPDPALAYKCNPDTCRDTGAGPLPERLVCEDPVCVPYILHGFGGGYMCPYCVPPEGATKITCDVCGCEADQTTSTIFCPNCNSECELCILPQTVNSAAKYLRGGSWTALGCINTGEPQAFVIWLLKFALGIGGGIALLLIIAGGVMVITSAGNPERVKAGKELITAAVIGLVLIIFSIFLLRLISGEGFLNIPGLT